MCSYLIEAHEVGEEGTVHIQGFCILKNQMRIGQLKELCPKAHFEAARGTPYQNYLYCAKGEQTHEEWVQFKDGGPNYGKNACFLEWGQRPRAPINAHKKKPPDDTYEQALQAPTVREGLEIVMKRKARDYCLHGDAIERNLKAAKKQTYYSKFQLSEFIRDPILLDKAVFICGTSNTGKTEWALAHFKNPLLVRHIDKLKTLSPDNDGIVFDDMSFEHWPAESVIHLLDMNCDSQLHVRYGTVTIPANTRKIFTSNKTNIFYKDEVPEEQKVAIERRYKRVLVYANLYDPHPVVPLSDVAPATNVNAWDRLVGARPVTQHYPMPERFNPYSLPVGFEPTAPGANAQRAPDDWESQHDFDGGDLDQVD